ncbi:hypothetical protein TNIN_146921 [Trichonephila inaurata madagascariensis]|uniref:Uncharacterized protein n=1 Tax=Trichonephila inaurata madagascariensis TaxID=2747483 RepID=A0A8X6XFL5_9ARAC|nr:hypothetical protein TNIN_146921 [Trichonephila inaurata madagascariensis]
MREILLFEQVFSEVNHGVGSSDAEHEPQQQRSLPCKHFRGLGKGWICMISIGSDSLLPTFRTWCWSLCTWSLSFWPPQPTQWLFSSSGATSRVVPTHALSVQLAADHTGSVRPAGVYRMHAHGHWILHLQALDFRRSHVQAGQLLARCRCGCECIHNDGHEPGPVYGHLPPHRFPIGKYLLSAKHNKYDTLDSINSGENGCAR